MRRVVVTGMGIWSCLGKNLNEVANNLRQGSSSIFVDEHHMESGLQSGLVGNVPKQNIRELLERKERVSMSKEAEFAYLATNQAIQQARLTHDFISRNEVGIIWGSDGNMEVVKPVEEIENQLTTQNIDAYSWIKSETSNPTICLCNIFGLKGISFCVGAACASGSHAIGIASIYIRENLQDIIVVGGSFDPCSESIALIDALGAVSLRNDNPSKASRPFDKGRDGMIPSGGAAALVLEEYEHAMARGAIILAEVCGYGFSSNGIEDISIPNAIAEYIAMKRAIEDAGMQPSDIDYVNAHGTSTPLGDIEEAKALTRLFVSENRKSKIENRPFISSTKSMTGHENWMAGASEAVYSILMMQNNFVAPNINLEHKIDEAKDLNIVTETVYAPINTVLSNSSGMGGTNSALVFKKL